MHNPAKPTGPTDERVREAWRAAVLAYRRERQAGELDYPAHVAAVRAILEVMPELSRKKASEHAQNAVAWAASEHTEWFWRGVGSSPRRTIG